MKPQFFICLAIMSFTYSWVTSRVVSSSALLPTRIIGMFALSSVTKRGRSVSVVMTFRVIVKMWVGKGKKRLK